MSAGSTASSARDPSFPVDLECEIFESAALMYPRQIPALLRVARRVLVWIEPFLYKTICASTHSVTAIKRKPVPFLHNTVRHLLLDYTDKPWSLEEARDILKLCTGVIDFAGDSYFMRPALLPILADMHIERLSASLEELFGDVPYIDLHHQLFAFVTRLHIFDVFGDREAHIFPHVRALPALTHLGMSEVPWSSVEKLLTDCAKLELLAFEWMDKCPFRDVRLVAALYKDYWQDWENGARARGNFWSVADTFVAGKRRGEIDGDRLWLEEYLFGLSPK
ncbi:hypothetical protein B0H11DRAFT_2060863, partial [Mycena galericulata]